MSLIKKLLGENGKMKNMSEKLKTGKDLLQAGAELLDKQGNFKIYEIYPTSYITENGNIIHTYDSLPKRGEAQ